MHYSAVVVALTAFASAASAFPTMTGRGVPVKAGPIKVGARDIMTAPLGLRTRDAIASGAAILKPLKFEGLSKRAQSTNLSKLDLKPQAQMIYGAPQSDGSMFLANMTLHAQNGQPLIMMESFETLTSSIDCDGSDGKMSLTFKDQAAMKYALEKWSWINQKKESQFILIANHQSCAPADQRVPYAIHNVQNNGLTTTLNASREQWTTVGETFEIDFGRASLPSGTARMLVRNAFQKRDFFDGIKGGLDKVGQVIGDGVDKVDDVINGGVDKVGEVAGDIGKAIQDGAGKVIDGVSGNGNFDGDVSISLDTGDAGKNKDLFSDPTGTIAVKCVDCNVRGSILLTGRVVVNNFKPSEISFTAQPVDVSAKAELGVVIAGTLDQFIVNPLKFSQNVVSIPLGGIVIPGVFSVGPKLDFEIGAELTAAAKAQFNFPIEGKLPNNAKITGNILNLKSSTATGFEGASAIFNPPKIDSVEGSIKASAFASPIIALGFEILNGAFGAEASIKFRTPGLDAEISAQFKNEGLCSQEAGASKTGLKISSQAVIDCTLFVGTDQTLGEIGLVEQSLFSFPFPFADVCLPVNIPGLAPVKA